MGILSFVVRSGIVVGAVYYSRKVGVWGNSEQTEVIYNDIKNELHPHVQRVEQQLNWPALPKTGEVRFLAKHYYNEGVKGTFNFIQMIPCYAGQLAKKAKNTFDEFSQSPATTTTAAAPPTNNAKPNEAKK